MAHRIEFFNVRVQAEVLGWLADNAARLTQRKCAQACGKRLALRLD